MNWKDIVCPVNWVHQPRHKHMTGDPCSWSHLEKWQCLHYSTLKKSMILSFSMVNLVDYINRLLTSGINYSAPRNAEQVVGLNLNWPWLAPTQS